MVGTLERRVGHLERRTGARENSEFCHCPGDLQVIWDDGLPVDPVAEICPRCGRPIRVITLEWPDDLGDVDDAGGRQ